MNIPLTALPVLLLFLFSPVMSFAEIEVDKCSWASQWCYQFSEIISSNEIELGDSFEITSAVEYLEMSTKTSGQMDIYFTVNGPGGFSHDEFQRKDMVRGMTKDFTFKFTPTQIGKYDIQLEITPPDRCCDHIFEIYTSSLNVVDEVSTPPPEIPSWIKDIAGWWSDGQINDEEFLKSMQWLFDKGILKLQSTG